MKEAKVNKHSSQVQLNILNAEIWRIIYLPFLNIDSENQQLIYDQTYQQNNNPYLSILPELSPDTKRTDVLVIVCEQKPRTVIEKNADAVVTQLVSQAVLVAVVDPLAHPVDWNCGRILWLFWKIKSKETFHKHRYYATFNFTDIIRCRSHKQQTILT